MTGQPERDVPAPGGAMPFDIADDLPTGRVVVEASAGTGKTYSIVGLATRFLAEGRCTAEQLLVVTFARSATRELRERLLDRLADAVELLDAAVAGSPPDTDDAVDVALLDADPDELARRRDRLGDALADVDTATISTIHGFCAQALAQLGDPGLGELLEDETAFATEIAGDLYLRALTEPVGADQLMWFPMFGPPIAAAGMRVDPQDVAPEPDLADKAGAKAWIAVEAGREAAARKRRAGLHTHDDLLRRLADRLTDPVRGTETAARIAGPVRVALVDEFQDTDPVQWRILSALFPQPPRPGEADRALVLVGDPKQAIYRFRGADVEAYLAVRGDVADATLPSNHRTDHELVRAVLALFEGRQLGHGIATTPVAGVAGRRCHGLGDAPLRLRIVPDDVDVRRGERGAPQVAALRDLVARDVAREAARLLTAGGTIDRAAGDHRDPAIEPGDLAVLVRTRRQAALVQRHLTDVGIPSVVNGVGSVLASPAARTWLHLLRALDRPADAGAARLAALGDLLGWTSGQLAAAGDAELDDLHVDLHRWRAVLGRDGVAAVLRHVSADTRLIPRLRRRPDGDRRLVDLQHVAELLHARAQADALGTAGLIAWLERAMSEEAASTSPAPPAHLAVRLEQADGAVQIMTVHGAKGLQFPIVLVPYLWDAPQRQDVVVDAHDAATGRRRISVGWGADHRQLQDVQAQQDEQEERRLAYVAATRAEHHLELWWAPSATAKDSPLGTLLGHPRRIGSGSAAAQAVDELATATGGLLDHRTVDPAEAVPAVAGLAGPVGPLRLARLDRPVDRGWRRSSYSRLVGDAVATAEASTTGPGDVDTPDAGDGTAGAQDPAAPPERPAAPQVPADPALAVPAPLGPMPGGAAVGTAVHALLEHLDFAADDLEAALRTAVERQARRDDVDLGDPDVVTAGLAAAVRTPLGPDAGALRLADLARGDRLDEMAFEIPVLGLDRNREAGRVLLGDVADLLDAHLPADDPLAGYADDLRRDLSTVEVRGFLAGFVDLVARDPRTGRYLVADHKTNRLAPPGADPLLVGHLAGAAMAAEMRSHHYPLQALIYLVAVHRYLRWRLPDYDPDTHLDGVAYLFLRGMAGPDTPVHDGVRCGVMRWRPPTSLLLALDRLLADGLDPGDRPARPGRTA